MAKSIGLKFIVNKSALKRIFYIYVPVLAAIYLLLVLAGFATTRPPSPPLDLAQDFAGKVPLVYSDNYNIAFFGLEDLHRFDTGKYGKIVAKLVERKAVDRKQLIAAAVPDHSLLLLAHSEDYLESLNDPETLARIIEVRALRFFPPKLTRNVVLEPMMYQTGGSLLAALAALKKGWAINLGGGFHHASYADGQGFCPLADISLIVKYLRREKLARKVMIIDLDAHQGNGHGADFKGDDDVFIVDVYNRDVYPHDETAKDGIDVKVELDSFTPDTEFLQKTEKALAKAFDSFQPDLVIYNAGTDILADDPLGGLDVSPAAVIKRDEMVFARARAAKAPVVMLLSGGYQKSNAGVIAESILNLRDKFGLF